MTTTTEERWRRHGLVGPIILIALGIAFLLSNLGALTIDWWEVLRFWPLLLILIGLDILTRHSRWGTVVVAIISLALVAGVFYWLAQPGARDIGYTQGRLVANPVTQKLGDADRVNVTLRMGAGDLRVGTAKEPTNVMEGNLDYPTSWAQAPYVNYSLSGGQGNLTIETRSQGAHWLFPFSSGPRGENWTVNLNPRVPLRLDVDAGASTSVLDLSRLQLSDLRIDSGVGRMEILFPPKGRDMTARINGGVGSVVLRIPEELPARIVIHGGLGSVSVPARFSQQGDLYETAGYSTATNRLSVTVEGGVGSIRVE